MTSSHSIQAYLAIPDLYERQEKVYECILTHPGASRNDVARKLKMSPNNVSSRIVELRKQGRVRVCGDKIDECTGYKVMLFETTDGVCDNDM